MNRTANKPTEKIHGRGKERHQIDQAVPARIAEIVEPLEAETDAAPEQRERNKLAENGNPSEYDVANDDRQHAAQPELPAETRPDGEVNSLIQ